MYVRGRGGGGGGGGGVRGWDGVVGNKMHVLFLCHFYAILSVSNQVRLCSW